MLEHRAVTRVKGIVGCVSTVHGAGRTTTVCGRRQMLVEGKPRERVHVKLGDKCIFTKCQVDKTHKIARARHTKEGDA